MIFSIVEVCTFVVSIIIVIQFIVWIGLKMFYSKVEGYVLAQRLNEILNLVKNIESKRLMEKT